MNDFRFMSTDTRLRVRREGTIVFVLWSLINVLQYCFLALWTALWVVIAIVVKLITGSTNVPLQMARRIWAPPLLFFTGAKIESFGFDSIDRARPYIYAVNHQSMIDIALVFREIPQNIVFVLKNELRKIPFLGWYTDEMGMVFVDRGNKASAIASMEFATRRIREGQSVIIFPEGTRSTQRTMLPFKKGVTHLALEAGVPVIPVAIEGMCDVRSARNMAMRPAKVKIRAGAPIESKTFDSVVSLHAAIESAVHDLHRSIGGEGLEARKVPGLQQQGIRG